MPIVGSDLQEHLLGTQAIIRAQEENSVATGLRRAAYWAGFRQEIYISLTCQRPTQLSTQACNVDRTFRAADDCTWACRAVAHCGDVLQFAFGDERQRSSRYQELVQDDLRWQEYRPASFDPFFVKEQSGCDFPDIRLHADWHGMRMTSLFAIAMSSDCIQ